MDFDHRSTATLRPIWTHPGMQEDLCADIVWLRPYIRLLVEAIRTSSLAGYLRASPPYQFDGLQGAWAKPGFGEAGPTCYAITYTSSVQSMASLEHFF